MVIKIECITYELLIKFLVIWNSFGLYFFYF